MEICIFLRYYLKTPWVCFMLSRFPGLLSLQSSHELHQITAMKRFSGCFWNGRTGAHMKRNAGGADRSANEIGSNRAALKLSLYFATAFFFISWKNLQWTNFKGVCLDCFTNTPFVELAFASLAKFRERWGESKFK